MQQPGSRFAPLVRTLVFLGAFLGPSAVYGNSDEEFVGPFPSWRDLRRDYGAMGDGKTDDTAALQRALDDLIKHEKACALFIPNGTYRLTRTVRTVRKVHTDCQGVAVIGEDPTTTILQWDGPKGDTIFQWDAWYAKISRLSLNGAGRAGIALLYGPAFSTYNETSDLIFRDAKVGLAFGGPQTQGQAENEVLRCRFHNCDTGVETVNWNSMDIWLWYCQFEDCGRGVHNVMGNWHVWHCLFLRSRIVDLSTQNLMVFSVVNNTSIGSKRFFDFTTGHSWGSPLSLTGNRVLDPTGDWAIILDNAGPYLVVDNSLRLSDRTRGLRMTWGDQTLVGNTYTRADAVEERGRFRRIAERVVGAKEIPDAVPALPRAPTRQTRKILEVAAGANGEAIQRAIDQASALAGQRPVVHLPMGNYKIERTLVIPACCDMQLVGDGAAETASRLNWEGPEGGIVLQLEGPSRATLRDFYISVPLGRALVIRNADQPGGRIFADQLNTSGPTEQKQGRTAALRIHGLDQTDVLLRALQGNGNGGVWVEVSGSPKAAEAKNQVNIFTGATSSAAAQYDIRDGGRLVVRSVYHERSTDSLRGLYLTDRGTLSIDATRFAYSTSAQTPTVEVDNFRGLFTLATCHLTPIETPETCRFELKGDGSAAHVLALNNLFWVLHPGTTADTVWQNKARPPVHGGLVGCNVNTPNRKAAPKGFAFLANRGDHPDPAKSKFGSGPLDDRGSVDDATILRHLEPLRSARAWLPDAIPSGKTDVRLHRVMATGGREAVVELRAGP
ncbi:MAG TPA: glycosyl hydrolase family 28-related protein [Gemmataceae bacterium]|nr:glycosyl hydrolase family 28-related protein [Gemmataceae bacterium]